MTDIDNLIDELWDLREKFELISTDPETELTGDDYREAKIDVAISQLEDVQEVKEQYEKVGLWPEDGE